MEHSNGENSIAKNIFIGYFVLILHVLLLVILGVFIVFFRGLIVYMPWIVGGGVCLMIVSGLWFYRKMKKSQSSLAERLSNGVPKDRAVEISFLGGLASVRLGTTRSGSDRYVDEAPLQLEDSETSRLRSLDRLVKMYNNDLISKEEFALLKQDVLQGSSLAVTENKEIIDVDFTSH